MEMVCGVIGRGRGGWKGKGYPGQSLESQTECLLLLSKTTELLPLSFLTDCLLCARDCALGSLACHLVTSTSLLNVSISPCLLGALRELTGVSSGLPEFCGKDKMHMLLLLQCSVFGNEQSCIVMQTPR